MKNKKIKEIKAEKYEENFEEPIEKIIEEQEKIEEYDEFEYVEEIENTDEYDEYNELVEDYVEDYKKSEKLTKISNFIFISLIIIMSLISIDVILVSKFDTGPFFAIKTKTHKESGTKEYYGLGYKVIKYNEDQGRKDIDIGSWKLKYSNVPTEIQDIDLAIEFQNDYKKAANKYHNQYLEITSKIKKVDTKNKNIIIEYTDPDGKYTLQINCNIEEDTALSNLKEQENIKIRGIVDKFYLKNGKEPNKIDMSNCYIR